MTTTYSLPNKLDIKIDAKPIILREATTSDLNYIYSSFLKSNRWDIPIRLIDNPNYYRLFHAKIEAVLKDSDYTVLLACNPSDEADILSYIVGSPLHLFYVKTRQPFANLGIATELIDTLYNKIYDLAAGSDIFLTNTSKSFKQLLDKQSTLSSTYSYHILL